MFLHCFPLYLSPSLILWCIMDTGPAKHPFTISGGWTKYNVQASQPTSITRFKKIVAKEIALCGSPGLVVMGGDSRSKGRGFESRRLIPDGLDIFSHWFDVKIVLFVWKRLKINEKEAGDGPFFLKKRNSVLTDKKIWYRPWWWSSGQRASLLLCRSEFESRWNFFCK